MLPLIVTIFLEAVIFALYIFVCLTLTKPRFSLGLRVLVYVGVGLCSCSAAVALALTGKIMVALTSAAAYRVSSIFGMFVCTLQGRYI